MSLSEGRQVLSQLLHPAPAGHVTKDTEELERNKKKVK